MVRLRLIHLSMSSTDEGAPEAVVPPETAQAPEQEPKRRREDNLLPPSPHFKKPKSKYEILVALRNNKGNRKLAAKELDLTVTHLGDRINDDPQLRQLYGADIEPQPALTAEAVEDRSKADIPLPSSVPEDEKASVAQSMKLISLVSPHDTERLIKGLKAFDFSEGSLQKIRALGDLAENTGRFIAVSLEKTHQNYVVQQFGLMELAADIRKRLLIPHGQEGYVADEETRAFLHKNYTEMVRESGRGVERMLQVAEVITRMLEASSSKAKAAKTKRGWRKVTAAETQANAETR